MVKKKTRTWSNDEMRKAVEVIQESRLLYRKAAEIWYLQVKTSRSCD